MPPRAAQSPARATRGAAAKDPTAPTGATPPARPVPPLNKERSGFDLAGPTEQLTQLWIARNREPCYIAARLWGVNSLDIKSMKAVVVFRVYLIFRPRGEAFRCLPAGTSRISSSDDLWTDELVDALPTLQVLNGKESDNNEKKEFFRITDAKSTYPGAAEPSALWFPPLPDEPEREGAVALVTYKIEATDVQLDMQFHEFPFDAHELHLKVFLPKKHKDSVYEFVCDNEMTIGSERIEPVSKGGKGIFEVKDAVEKSLFEWTLVRDKTKLADGESVKKVQSEAQLVIAIRRRPQFYLNKYIHRPGVIATLACVSFAFPVSDLADRLGLTFTLLLTLTGINYTAGDILPTLPYSTALDHYHEACHNFVYSVIAQNLLLYLFHRHLCEQPEAAAAPPPLCVTTSGMAIQASAAPTQGDVEVEEPPAEASGESAAVAVESSFKAAMHTICEHSEVQDWITMAFIVGYWWYWNRRWFRVHTA